MLDVAIIGGGLAGCTAAYRLRDLDVRVFETNDTVGGRARTVRVAGEPVNLGPQVVYLGTPTEALCKEMGLNVIDVKPEAFSCHFAGSTVVAHSDDELLETIRMSPEGRAELRRVVARLQDLYHTYAARGLTVAADELSTVSFADFIGSEQPEVVEFFNAACVAASTAFPDELSAQFGIRYVASYLNRDGEHRGYLEGGVNEISLAVAKRLGPAVELSATVRYVSAEGAGYRLVVDRGGVGEEVHALQVIFALQGPLIPDLHPALPEWKRRAVTEVPYAAYVGMGVVLAAAEANSWDEVFLMPVHGRAFQTVYHQTVERRQRREPGQNTVLCLYLHNRPAESLQVGDDDERLKAEWLDDLYEIFPDARGRVVSTTAVTRWRYCFAFPTADRPERLPALEARVDGLHFAGDWASATAGMHGAIAAGNRAAREVLSVVQAVS